VPGYLFRERLSRIAIDYKPKVDKFKKYFPHKIRKDATMIVEVPKIGKRGRPKLPPGQKGVKVTIYITPQAEELCLLRGRGNVAAGAREIIDEALAKYRKKQFPK
jgi:hypothetical protein